MCILSPILFNLYSEDIVSKSLDVKNAGIANNDAAINNLLRYTDDIVLLAGSHGDLQTLIHKIVTVSEKLRLSLNQK